MKVVCVTSCPSGIAHTFMIAEVLTKMFKERGIEVKIEMQGQLGPENILTPEEIKEADAIVFANGIAIVEPERFEGYEEKTVQVPMHTALRKPEKIIDEMKKKNLIQ